MNWFRYTAVDAEGVSHAGQVQAPDANAAAQLLGQQGLTPSELTALPTELPVAGQPQAVPAPSQIVASDEDLYALQAVAGLASSGLPVIAGIRALAAESVKSEQARWLNRLADHLERGETLQDAVTFERSIPPAIAELLRISPSPNAALESLNRYMRVRRSISEMKRQLVLTLTYPICLLVAMWSVATLAAMKTYQERRAFVIDWGFSPDEAQSNLFGLLTKPELMFWPGMAIFCGCVVAALWIGGRGSLAAALSRVFIVGSIPRYFALGERLTLVGLLLQYGATLPRALSLVAETGSGREYRDLFRYWCEAIRDGIPWSQAIERQGAHLAVLQSTVAWGEQNSILGEACDTAAGIYLDQATWQTNLVRLVAPAVIFVTSIFILAMFIQNVLSPLVRLIQVLAVWA